MTGTEQNRTDKTRQKQDRLREPGKAKGRLRLRYHKVPTFLTLWTLLHPRTVLDRHAREGSIAMKWMNEVA